MHRNWVDPCTNYTYCFFKNVFIKPSQAEYLAALCTADTLKESAAIACMATSSLHGTTKEQDWSQGDMSGDQKDASLQTSHKEAQKDRGERKL